MEYTELVEPRAAAEVAGIRYVSDNDKGIMRRKAGKGFVYIDANGNAVSDPATLQRIKSLVIPPAWSNVWICRRADGHIQASGRDGKGRKQYIYHAKWAEIRTVAKFGRMIAFGEALPEIRRQVSEHLRRRSPSYERVMALIVRLLEQTMIRVGNQEYVRQNESHGLTTLQDHHVEIEREEVRFIFRGKSGKQWHVQFRDRRLARMIRECQELPGQELFRYYNGDKQLKTATSEDVNAYLRAISGQDFTAKDFRTWGGSVMAARELLRIGPGESARENLRVIRQTVKQVAHILSNTPSVCRKYYIHPRILETYLNGEFCMEFQKELEACEKTECGLDPEELALLMFLRNHPIMDAACS